MIGQVFLGRYRIDSELGKGGMGVVYSGHDLLLDRDVAIKVLSGTHAGPGEEAPLLREARAIARLSHPNIVNVYDAGETGGLTFVVMELVEGMTLEKCPPKDLKETLSIACQVCEALDHAHSRGIIHRDLKPENIFITSSGRARLMDFGLARSVSSRLTSEGMIMGTVFYLAPEQALGQTADPRTDLYALGVLLYELVAGRLPFSGDDPLAVISQHLYAPVVPPRAYNPALSPALDALIVRLLAKQPGERPASAQEVLETLQRESQRPAGEPIAPPGELLIERIVRGRVVGRERELGEIVAAWERATSGSGGEHVLLVSGEPGIGKTRLARELMVRAQVVKATVLLGECYAEGEAPYAPLSQAIRQAMALPALANKDSLPDLVLADLISLVPELRSRYPDLPTNPPIDPQAERQRLYESVTMLFLHLSKQAPVLLVVEDAHWADSGTLALLRHLARRGKSADMPLLIVVTYREVELDEARSWKELLLDFHRERLATRVKLARLNKDQTCDLLGVLFDEDITPEFLEAIYLETEGNPFFIEEVCKALIEEGKLTFRDGRWRRPPMSEILVPQSIRMAIQARLGRLPEAVQETLRLAAVFGREFEAATLQKAGGYGEEALMDALESAERGQLINEIRQAGPGEVRYAFTHALIPATIYDSLSGLRRQRLHRRAARAVGEVHPEDFDALAHHYRQGGEPETARKYLIKAGQRALQVYANPDAVKSFRQALEIGGPEVEKAQALWGLCQALFWEGRYEDLIRACKEVIPVFRALSDQDGLARAYALLTQALRLSGGDIDAAIETGKEGLALLEGQPASPGLADLLIETSVAFNFRSQNDQAILTIRQALQMAEQVGDVAEQAEALVRLGYLLDRTLQRHEEGRQMLERAIEMGEQAGLWEPQSGAHLYLGRYLFNTGNLNHALQHFLRAAELDRQAGWIWAEIYIQRTLGNYYSEVGEYREVENAWERGRTLLELTDSTGPPTLAFGQLEALVCWLRGEEAQAIDILREKAGLASQEKNMNWYSGVATDLSVYLGLAGQWAKAEQVMLDFLRIAETEFGGWQYCWLSRVRSRLGKPDQARRALEKAREKFASAPLALELWGLGEAEADLAAAEGRWEEAWAKFLAVEQAYAQHGYRRSRTLLLEDWADAHLQRGAPEDVVEARRLLSEAQKSWEAMGVNALAREVASRLAGLTG